MSRRVSVVGSYSGTLPLTTAYLTAISIPNNGTIYYPGTAQEITGAQIWSAVNAFEQSGYTHGWLAIKKAIYLFIGGTASTHSVNFLNPALVSGDPLFINWFGGMTHSKTGIVGNAINGYGSFNKRPGDIFTANHYQAGIYVRTNVAGDTVILGQFNSTTECFIVKHTDSTQENFSNTFSDKAVYNTANKRGWIVGGKDSSSHNYIDKNGVRVANGTGGGTLSPNPGSLLLSAFGIGVSPTAFDNNEYACVILSDSDTEASNANEYAAVQALQTALHRQV